MSAPQNSSPQRSAPHAALLAMALIGMFFLLVAANGEWIYNFIDWVDGWAYFGLGYHANLFRQAFPEAPQTDLLPLMIPAAIFHKAFSPLTANLLYKLASFATAGWLMHSLLELEFGRRTAALGTLSFLLCKAALAALGSDYTEGRVIVFYAAALLMALKAAGSASPARALFWCGFWFAMSVSTALLSIVYLPVLAFLYYGKRWQAGGSRAALPATAELAVPLGFAAGVLLLCCVSAAWHGNFIYFHNTLAKAASYMNQNRAHSGFDLRPNWLALPLYTLFAGAAFALHRRFIRREKIADNRGLLFCAASLLSMAILAFLQIFRHQNTIGDAYYFNQTLPLTFAAAAGIFYAPFADRISRAAFFALLASMLTLGIWQFHAYALAGDMAPAAYNEFSGYFALLLTLAALALFDMKPALPPLLAAAALVFVLNLNAAPGWRLKKSFNATPAAPDRRTALELSVPWIKEMDRVDPMRRAYLWYDRWKTGPYLGGLVAASHLWQARTYNEYLPYCDRVLGERGILPPQILLNQPLIILADRPEKYIQGKANLSARGIALSCGEGIPFNHSGRHYFDYYVCSAEKAAPSK